MHRVRAGKLAASAGTDSASLSRALHAKRPFPVDLALRICEHTGLTLTGDSVKFDPSQAEGRRGCKMPLTDTEIGAWANSETAIRRIAASLATMIKSGSLSQFSSLPDNEELAREWSVSRSTVMRAKRLLADHELITLGQGREYYVA